LVVGLNICAIAVSLSRSRSAMGHTTVRAARRCQKSNFGQTDIMSHRL
jgi:hypothetical protein